MAIKLLERNDYAKELLKDQDAGTDENVGKAIRKGMLPISIKAVGDNTIRFIISDGSLDRDRDTINVQGWNLTNFVKNPVVLWAHQHHSVPIGKGANIGVEDDALMADAIFVGADIMPFADMVFQLYKGGFMNAVSVGFLPDERVFSEDQGGIKFLTQELLEFSAVPVPANPNALQVARSGGIDISPLNGWAEKVLDEWQDGMSHNFGASRKALERMFKEAGDKKPSTIGININSDKQKELRQRNIWEPRLKEYRETGEWLDAWGKDMEDVPAYLWDEHEEIVKAKEEEAVKAEQEKRTAYAQELMDLDNPLLNDLCKEYYDKTDSEDFEQLADNLGKKAIEIILGFTAEYIENIPKELREELEKLKVESEELVEMKEWLVDENYEKINAITESLTDMTEERDQLLIQLAESVVDNNSELRVDPVKMIKMFGNEMSKAMKRMTGKID